MKILLADDDEFSRLLVKAPLRNLGYDVYTCKNGREAWEQLSVGDYRVVISDWLMPEMDGIELCQKIRAANRPNYCYFIMLTGKTDKSEIMAGMDAGADDYLTKPVNLVELKVRLRVAERILALYSDVQALRGILPVCAWCKKVRDDDDLWISTEQYLADHTKAELSHSICPRCTETAIQSPKSKV